MIFRLSFIHFFSDSFSLIFPTFISVVHCSGARRLQLPTVTLARLGNPICVFINPDPNHDGLFTTLRILDPTTMSQHTVHARLLHRRIGIANIPLTSIDMHLQHRPPSLNHVSSLKDELNKDLNSRWAYPIDLVLDATVPMPWLRSLSTNRLTLDPPSSGRFTCIGGQHRLLAARQLYDEWTPSEESQEMDPSLGFYPANIYESCQYASSSR
jgi:hypothetical protein